MSDKPQNPFSGLEDIFSTILDAQAQRKISAIAQIISGARELDILGIIKAASAPVPATPPVAPAEPVIKPAINPNDPFGYKTAKPEVTGFNGVDVTSEYAADNRGSSVTPEDYHTKIDRIRSAARLDAGLSPLRVGEKLRDSVKAANERAAEVRSKTKRGVIDINGWQHEVDGEIDLLVLGNTVLLNGVKIDVDFTRDQDVLEVKVVEGTVRNLISSATITANRAEGNLYARGDASVGAVGGNATVQGDLNAGTIGGNATVTGDVNATKIGGSVTATGDVTIRS